MISEHISLEDVNHTDHAIVNECPPEYAGNAIRLANDVLEPLWVLLGPLKFNSWFRCGALNSLVGGEKPSYHLEALAADVVPTGDVFSKFKMALTMLHELPIDKIIFEKRRSQWIHIQTNRDGNKPRHLAFTAEPGPDGKMIYKACDA
jgi:hypothetical protein